MSAENFVRTYEVSIGSGLTCDLVGRVDDMRQAEELVKRAVAAARDLLAAALAKSGMLSAELALGGARGPELQIHFVPEAVDRAVAFDKLRRRYDELLAEAAEEDRDKVA